jgi:hypothetical protein
LQNQEVLAVALSSFHEIETDPFLMASGLLSRVALNAFHGA